MSLYLLSAAATIVKELIWFPWLVVTGSRDCEVESASENQLLCIIQSEEKTHVVTNQGSHLSTFLFPSLCVKQDLRRWMSGKPG